MQDDPHQPSPAAEALQSVRENAAKIAAHFRGEVEKIKKEIAKAEQEAQRLRCKLYDLLEAKNAAQIELFFSLLK